MSTFQRVEVETEDGLPLSVIAGGDGPPVLLLHGFTGTGDAWGEGVLDGLARHHRVLAPDLLGHGRSARPTDPSRYAIDRVVADMVGVAERLAEVPPVWVGYSMGARIALAAAVDGLVSALVLESGSPGIEGSEARAERRAGDEARARQLEAGGIEAFVNEWMRMPLFASQRRLPSEILERERARRIAQDPQALAACLRGLGTGSQPSCWERLSTVGSPTLILTGALDAKFETIGERMGERLPRASCVTVPGAGHAVHLEAPTRWLEVVGAFLRGDPA